MYSLMRSERILLDHVLSGPLVSYRQKEISRFREFQAAITARQAAPEEIDAGYYILNDLGQEYFGGTWIS